MGGGIEQWSYDELILSLRLWDCGEEFILNSQYKNIK